MRRQGRHESATTLLIKMALGLEADRADATTASPTTYGSLLCTAAYSCAQNGDRSQAFELVDEAGLAGRRLANRGVHRSTVFSITNLSLYKIGIFNALGEPSRAVTESRDLRHELLPTTERSARYCIDTARAWQLHGRPEQAARALLMAERVAPEELQRPSVRSLVSGLLHAPGRPPAGLRHLVSRIHMARN